MEDLSSNDSNSYQDTAHATEGKGSPKLLGAGIAVLLLLLTSLSFVVYKGWPSAEGHLIAHVPYKGQFTGSSLATQSVTAVASILAYWGDTRFTEHDLHHAFPSFEDTGPQHLGFIASFFKEHGYNAEELRIIGVDELTAVIKKDIPVIVYQRLGVDAPAELISERLLIGFSEKDNVLIFHDNDFGNNYEISYEDFALLNERLPSGTAAAMLIVTPGDGITGILEGSDETYEYPERLRIMDSPGIRKITINWREVVYLITRFERTGTPGAGRSVELLNEIIAHESFDELHPAHRMLFAYQLAGFYMGNLGKSEEAIAVLENVVTPLVENYDFNESFGEWKIRHDMYKNPFWKWAPWARLGYLYTRTGDIEKAEAAFQKSLEYWPDNEESLNALAELK